MGIVTYMAAPMNTRTGRIILGSISAVVFVMILIFSFHQSAPLTAQQLSTSTVPTPTPEQPHFPAQSLLGIPMTDIQQRYNLQPDAYGRLGGENPHFIMMITGEKTSTVSAKVAIRLKDMGSCHADNTIKDHIDQALRELELSPLSASDTSTAQVNENNGSLKFTRYNSAFDLDFLCPADGKMYEVILTKK